VDVYHRDSELARHAIDDARKVLKEGQEIEALITGVDRKKRSVSLSIKAREARDEVQALEVYGTGGAITTTKLGDLLKQQMDETESAERSARDSG